MWSGSGEDLLLTVSSRGGEQREEVGALGTLQGASAIPEGATVSTSSGLNHLPKAHLLIHPAGGGWAHRMNAGDTVSLQHSPFLPLPPSCALGNHNLPSVYSFAYSGHFIKMRYYNMWTFVRFLCVAACVNTSFLAVTEYSV